MIGYFLRGLALLSAGIFAIQPAHAQARPGGLPSVSIVEMEDMAQSGQSDVFRTMIQSAITSTGKFRVFEDNTNQLERRQARANSGTFTSRTPGRRGGFEGADFLVYGSITTGSAQRRQDIGSTIGRVLLFGSRQTQSCDRMVTTLAVDVRVVDARTGQARYAEQLNQQNQSGVSCSGNPQTDVANLLRTTANTIARNLVTTIYPIQVAMVQADGIMILNYGQGTLTAGQVLNLYGPSSEVPNPANGTMMRVDGSQIGRIRITEVTPQFSRATALSPFASPPPVGSIARVVQLTPDEVRQMREQERRQQRGGRR